MRLVEQLVRPEMGRRGNETGRRGRGDNFAEPGERSVQFDADLQVNLTVPVDRDVPAGPSRTDATPAGAPLSLERLEEQHIRRILEQTPSMTRAAEILGIDQATLYRKRKKLGLG